jgi:predicted lipid-binding transport protein (Tim44 family)
MRFVAKTIAFLSILTLLAMSIPEDTWARAGGGSSMGSRGSRSFSSPSRSYSAPAPSTTPSAQPQPAPAPAPIAQPAPAGGFMRSLAGGLVGGLLGGMLFRGLGFAGNGEGFGGGFGMMDLLLLAGIAYLIFWFIRRNRAAQEAPATGYASQMSADASGWGAPAATLESPQASWQQDLGRGIGHIRQMDPGFDEAIFRETCTDLFFKIQAAWMHRDLDKLRPLMTEEMQDAFGKQMEAARAKRQINKLENITVRSVEPTEAWQEQGRDYVTVRFLANLLDYTVDETTGKVVDGSDSVPVKFEEFWTWMRPVGSGPWQLCAINQAD